MKRSLLLAACLAALACDNGGADRTIGVTATGVVRGSVFFDANASGSRDAADAPVAGARIALLDVSGRDTVLRGVTASDGTYRIPGVPVGRYRAVLDVASAGDSVEAAAATPLDVTIVPGDSVEYTAAVAFPVRSAAAVRTLAPGTRVIVRAVALHARETFGDTALHLVDTSGALRATRVRRPSAGIVAGDSLALSGRVAIRAGQRVLDDVTTFALGPAFIPAAPSVTTAAAATAGAAGVLDAALVLLTNALVADTATVAGNLQLTLNDGSGAVVMVLDRAADPGFRAPLPAGLYVPGARFDVAGILVPSGTGPWRIKPRSPLDLVRR